MEKVKCKFCGKTIRKYKKWRDWKTRKSHYKCWKEDREMAFIRKQAYEYKYSKNKPIVEQV